MSEVKLLGAKVDPIFPQLPAPFRFSLGRVDPKEMADLLSDAFEMDVPAWLPSEDLLSLPMIRAGDRLVAACSVLRPCFLHQFVVAPEVQMQGLGRKLYEWTTAVLELDYVLVSTDETTRPAGHKFWQALGFREVGA